MMGLQPRTDSLFYYFRLEDQIPDDHLLKRLDRFIDFGFVRERLRDTYSAIGRPSIDPEVLLRLLLVGYLYGITSERRLIEEVRMHLAYRWFSRLGFEREIPDHSTFSKNRHGRFCGVGVFLEVFEEIVRRCLEAGLVEGKRLTVDGTMVSAGGSDLKGWIQDPKHREWFAAKVDTLANQIRIRTEAASPETAGHHRHGRSSRAIFLRRKGTSGYHARSEQPKKLLRNVNTFEGFGTVSAR